MPPGKLFELANAFDEAVEFAALEGVSIAEAIAGFFADAGVAPDRPLEAQPPEYRELARLAGYGRSPVDLATLDPPVMPKLVSRLLRTSNEETSPAELENIAAADPVLAGKLLGAANSALFGSGFEIVRLRDAVMRLGIAEARKILMASCFSGLFASRQLQDLWEHSQAVADGAAGLAKLARVDPETAWLAGLLHDVGRLALAKLPAKLRIHEQEWLAAGFPLCYAETLAYGLDHAAMGAQFLRAWELPPGIVEAVRLHHRPSRSGPPLNAVLTLAEDLAANDPDTKQPPEDLWSAMRRVLAAANAGILLDHLDASAQSNAVETSPALRRGGLCA